MLRRSAALLALLAGGVLVILIVRQRPGDTRQTFALVGLLAGGVCINIIAAGCRHLPLRGLVRNLASLVGLTLLIGTLALWYWLGEHTALPPLARPDPVFRDSLLRWREVLVWLSVAVAYVTVSIALLPRPVRPKEGKR
jgi:hypothetical protein